MKVEDWLRRHPIEPVLVPADAGLDALLEALVDHPGATALYVADADGRIMGDINARRLAHRAIEGHRPVHTRRQIFERVAGGRADELMNPHYVHARPDERLLDVLHRLLEAGAWELPVIDRHRRPLGCVRLSEVLKDIINKELL